MKKVLFWIVSKTAFGLYKRFPVFGDLRASVGILERDGQYLVIRRNDGRGLSFPGGIARPFELEAATLIREVREETGLTAEEHELLFAYRTDIDISVSNHGFPDSSQWHSTRIVGRSAAVDRSRRTTRPCSAQPTPGGRAAP